MKIDDDEAARALPASSSSRVNVTALGGLGAGVLRDNDAAGRRAAHSVFESDGARSTAVVQRSPVARDEPAGQPAGPSATQSPHVTA